MVRAAARARGRAGTRPLQSSPPEQARLARARYEARDVTVAEIARALGVGRGTIYRAVPLFLRPPCPALPCRPGPRRRCRPRGARR